MIIAPGVESIGRLAFKGCTRLTFVTIPDTVTDLTSLSFDGCGKLTIY